MDMTNIAEILHIIETNVVSQYNVMADITGATTVITSSDLSMKNLKMTLLDLTMTAELNLFNLDSLTKAYAANHAQYDGHDRHLASAEDREFILSPSKAYGPAGAKSMQTQLELDTRRLARELTTERGFDVDADNLMNIVMDAENPDLVTFPMLKDMHGKLRLMHLEKAKTAHKKAELERDLADLRNTKIRLGVQKTVEINALMNRLVDDSPSGYMSAHFLAKLKSDAAKWATITHWLFESNAREIWNYLLSLRATLGPMEAAAVESRFLTLVPSAGMSLYDFDRAYNRNLALNPSVSPERATMRYLLILRDFFSSDPAMSMFMTPFNQSPTDPQWMAFLTSVSNAQELLNASLRSAAMSRPGITTGTIVLTASTPATTRTSVVTAATAATDTNRKTSGNKILQPCFVCSGPHSQVFCPQIPEATRKLFVDASHVAKRAFAASGKPAPASNMVVTPAVSKRGNQRHRKSPAVAAAITGVPDFSEDHEDEVDFDFSNIIVSSFVVASLDTDRPDSRQTIQLDQGSEVSLMPRDMAVRLASGISSVPRFGWVRVRPQAAFVPIQGCCDHRV